MNRDLYKNLRSGCHAFSFLGLLLVSSAGNLSQGQETASKSDVSATRPMAAVFNIERSNSLDVLTLETGGKLAGTLLNADITVRTACGSIKVETRWLAGIELPEGPTGLASIVTVNRNHLTGFIEDSVLRFEPRGGAASDIRREKVRRLIFAIRQDEPSRFSPAFWLQLRNGDRLSGRLDLDSLVLNGTNGQKTVKLNELRTLTVLGKDQVTVSLALRNGITLCGTMPTESLPIQLDVGPRLDLYAGCIDWISHGSDPENHVTADESVANGNGNGHALDASARVIEGMVWIPAGEFLMGSPTDEIGRDIDEGPQTKVIVPQGFWMGKCEVTQAEYRSVLGVNPSINPEDSRLPVEKISWFEAMEYCAQLTRQAEPSGRLPKGYVYRLPTEAEWEYACRAGTMTRFSYGDDKTYSQLGDYAWFVRNGESTAHPAGTRRPNPWGLYDMHGNVWEWCLDRWSGALPGGTITNNVVVADGTLRVARGGSWLYEARACRSANRDDYSPSNRCGDVGFRVVLAPVQP